MPTSALQSEQFTIGVRKC